MRASKTIHIVLAAGLMASLASCRSHAGAYIFAETSDEDFITHPTTYTGAGGNISVRICIAPSSPNSAAMEIPVQNNINIFNRLVPTTGNLLHGGSNNVPSSNFDFESVALHEIGHCLGLAHVNAASESGLSSPGIESTKARVGVNGVLDTDAGTDGIMGSSDDIRGDDINVHWFRISNNDPFTVDTIIDGTTYSRDSLDLPSGHSFAANAARAVSQLLGYGNTEAVMQQGTFFDEAQRTLNHDDVATLKLAASGIDETDGTTDDYTITLEYGGISATNCDVSMSLTSTSSLAFCSVGGSFIGPPVNGHLRVTNAVMEFGQGFNWYFNDVTVNQPPVITAIGDQNITENATLDIAVSASDADNDNISLSASGLPAFITFTDLGNGSGSLDINPALGDAGIYPITVSATDDGLPQLTTDEMLTVTIDELDTDDDGLSDFAEINTYGTDPLLADTDSDFFDDGFEVAAGTDPLDPASTPSIADGDVNGDGQVNTGDLVKAMRILTGLDSQGPTDLARWDVAPLVSGVPVPDGQNNIADYMVIQQKILGLVSF